MKSISLLFIIVLANSECFASSSVVGRRFSSLFPIISTVKFKRTGVILPFQNYARLASTYIQSEQDSAWNKLLRVSELSAPSKGLLGKLQPLSHTLLAPALVSATLPSVPLDIVGILYTSPSETDLVYNIIKDHYSMPINS